mgnify:CR=1 FL=1
MATCCGRSRCCTAFTSLLIWPPRMRLGDSAATQILVWQQRTMAACVSGECVRCHKPAAQHLADSAGQWALLHTQEGRGPDARQLMGLVWWAEIVAGSRRVRLFEHTLRCGG